MIKVLCTSIFIILLLFCTSYAREAQINVDGDVVHDDVTAVDEQNSLSVSFQNNLKEKIALYWYERTKDEVEGFHMFDLTPGETANLNTFEGHNFFATYVANGKGSPQISRSLGIQEFTMTYQQTSYYVGESVFSKPIHVPQSEKTRPLNSENDPARRTLNIEVRSRKHPLVLSLAEDRLDSSVMMNAKFRSLSPRKIDIWYDDGTPEGTPQGTLSTGMESTTNTFVGHVFYVTLHEDRSTELVRFTMEKGRVLYVIFDDENHPAPPALLERTQKELDYMDSYLATHGIRWRHYYGPNGPRSPPTLFHWPAPEIGAVHSVVTPQGYWSCAGAANECQSTEPVTLELEVVSLQPRVFFIENFLSIFEADSIVEIARPKINISFVGNYDAGGARVSTTRTSKNAWVSRPSSPITETLFLRAADLLNLDEKILNSHENAEDMQVVNYQLFQKYDSHHDWGVSGYENSRFITLLLYLTDGEEGAGGETAFPKGDDGRGFKVKPKKGSAVLFYNLLEDGNGDDLALHAALPVRSGEKWLANFWVWDPKRR